jgi:hypothetical protein
MAGHTAHLSRKCRMSDCYHKVCTQPLRLFPLNISNVKKEIETALFAASEFCAECPKFVFLRLSDTDLQFVCDYLNDQNLSQQLSKHSIVIKSSEVFWKHIPRMVELSCCKSHTALGERINYYNLGRS